jgi:hypothetical protein
MPEHPLADSTGHVWEHRKLMYDRYGETLPPCELCRKPITWETTHIDHIDDDPSNNDPKNLRPLCRGCNVSRPLRTDSVILTVDGVSKSAAAWSKDPRISVCYKTILRRKAAGASDIDALFGVKKTHRNEFACTCGEPLTPRVMHRIDAPCYVISECAHGACEQQN